MKSKNFDYTETAQIPVFDPFPEPHTLPVGWDLSELIPENHLPVPISANLLDIISINA